MSNTARRPLFCGNWKLNGSIAEGIALASEVRNGVATLSGADVVVGPTFTALYAVAKALEGGSVAVAAQDCFWEDKGAFTGEVSASQLADVGCKYVILGHSERRQFFGDDDKSVNLKTRAVLRAGLQPIICVGETLAERDAGQTLARVQAQTDAAIADLADADLARCLVAYEPVWAIGTGRTATPAQAQEVHAFIRTRLAAKAPAVAVGLRILYGGSMKPDNVRSLMAEADVDGGLVGGASLVAESFIRMVREGS
jgi:triosephosphate isomerase